MDMMKLRLEIEKASRYRTQLEEALECGNADAAADALVSLEHELDALEEDTDFVMSGYWTARVVGEDRDKEVTGPGYYVTLCIKTDSGTQAIQWHYNAKFDTMASAKSYRDSLLSLVDQINSLPLHERGIPQIEGERIVAITDNPAKSIVYIEYQF